mmetsp:Transcript_23166/g.57224  ORF Transcript_23166/g.57224 Transcript_23166/m.57224 type:complete len:342 (+) Transcript_23166:1136-2161(+)
MVVEVRPDARYVCTALDAVGLQMGAPTDAGQHQHVRRAHGARTQHNLPIGVRTHLPPATIPVDDARGDAAVEHHALHQGLGHHRQVWTVAHRIQIATGGAPALAVVGRLVKHAEAFLLRSILVVRVRVAELLARLEERQRQWVGRGGAMHVQRSAIAAEIVPAAVVGLHPPEVGQHLPVRPALAACLRPAIEVLRVSTDVDHPIDGGRPSQHLAAVVLHLPAAQPGLHLALEGPVVARAVDVFEHHRRHLQRQRTVRSSDCVVLRAGLDQQHAVRRVAAEPIGQHAAGGARADNHVIKKPRSGSGAQPAPAGVEHASMERHSSLVGCAERVRHGPAVDDGG